MKNPRIIFLVLMFCGCKARENNSFESRVSKVFFNANLSESYQSAVNYYRSLDILSELAPPGWTIYPPLSALEQTETDTSFRSFEFNKNPGLADEFGKGKINIRKGGSGNKGLAEFTIFYIFKTLADAEKAYKAEVEKLIASQAYKRDSLGKGLKVMEFFESNGEAFGIRVSLSDKDSTTGVITITVSLIRKAGE